MNVSAVDDQRFQFTTTSDALANSIMATETPLIANECPSIYHNSPATLRTSGDATAVNGNHEPSLVFANDIVPVAAQLKLVHDGMEFFFVEYPIQLLSEEAAAGTGNSPYVDGTPDGAGDTLEISPAVSSEIHGPFMNIPALGNNVSQQLSTIETLTATKHDGTVSKVMNPGNHPKYHPRKPYCLKTVETLRRMSNIADRTVQSTKRQADINILLPSTAPKHKNMAMQKHNILNIHPQFKRNRSQANIKPLQISFPCNEQATLYKVVCPGKINAINLLLKNICGNDSRAQRKSARAGMPQPMLQQPVKRALYVPVQETRSLSSKRRSHTDHVLNKTGVQTRSGRLSKPPQALADGFVCRVTEDDHHRQQPSREVNTFHEVHFHLDENKENPEQLMAKLAPTTARRKAKVQPQYQCGTCHKIYLGRRMARHLHAYPTHVTLDKLDTCETKPDAMDSTPATPALPSFKPALHDPSLSPPTQLYRLLVDLVTAPQTESNQRAVLLGEISQFVGLVRSRVPSLIVPSEQEDNETVYVDQNVADVLQLNPGNYRIRMDAFVQEREKFLHNEVSGSDKSGPARPISDAAEQKDPDSANVVSELECELTAVSSFEALLQDFAELEEQEQQGLLAHLPLPLSMDGNENEDLKANLETVVPVLAHAAAPTAFSEPTVMSNQGTTAFGRLCQLSEELFPSHSQEVLQAFEELTNLSELCSPQVLGVSGVAAANESSSALAFD